MVAHEVLHFLFLSPVCPGCLVHRPAHRLTASDHVGVLPKGPLVSLLPLAPRGPTITIVYFFKPYYSERNGYLSFH